MNKRSTPMGASVTYWRTGWRIVLVMGWLLLTHSAWAGFGRMTVQSALGQPLRAEVDLIGEGDVSALHVNVASREQFRSYQLDYPAYVATLTIQVAHRPDGSLFLLLQSAKPVTTPSLSIVLELESKSGRQMQSFSVLMDAAGNREWRSPPSTVSTAPVVPVQQKEASPKAQPVLSHPVAATPATPPSTPPAAMDDGNEVLRMQARGKNPSTTPSIPPAAIDDGNEVLRMQARNKNPSTPPSTPPAAIDDGNEVLRMLARDKNPSAAPSTPPVALDDGNEVLRMLARDENERVTEQKPPTPGINKPVPSAAHVQVQGKRAASTQSSMVVSPWLWVGVAAGAAFGGAALSLLGAWWWLRRRAASAAVEPVLPAIEPASVAPGPEAIAISDGESVLLSLDAEPEPEVVVAPRKDVLFGDTIDEDVLFGDDIDLESDDLGVELELTSLEVPDALREDSSDKSSVLFDLELNEHSSPLPEALVTQTIIASPEDFSDPLAVEDALAQLERADDPIANRLDLARLCLEMGSEDDAHEMLQEVLSLGNTVQREAAQAMLATLDLPQASSL